MTLPRVRWATALFFLLYTVAVTWPGAVPFNRIRPLVGGLPFSMVWVALWLVLSFGVLIVLDRFETRDEDERGGASPGAAGREG